MTTSIHFPKKFSELPLRPEVFQALLDLGFETPTSIQEAAIPALMGRKDIIGQARTGTGKTLAFSAPALSLVDPELKHPQVIILTPTRELAIQVADSVKSYSTHLKSVKELAVYGGQSYRIQLKALKAGPQMIVGTPGRVMDMIKQGALDLSEIRLFVLDEADEMLKMGFIDDVEWILSHAPEDCQRALFSATMPSEIKKIAHQYLRSPEHIQIKEEERSTSSIEQFYCVMPFEHRTAALCRYLTLEHSNATLIFTRTKNDSTELAEKLISRGYKAAAINGDMTQSAREKVIQTLKSGVLDIVVATDVAARGLDVDRIEFVVNFDLPYEVESYVHRIGRTGRAGRSGKALSLISPRDLRLLRLIQKQTGFNIQESNPPSADRLKRHAKDMVLKGLGHQIETHSWDQEGSKQQFESLKLKLNCDADTLGALLLSERLNTLIGVVDELPDFSKKSFEKPVDRKRPRRDRGYSNSFSKQPPKKEGRKDQKDEGGQKGAPRRRPIHEKRQWSKKPV